MDEEAKPNEGKQRRNKMPRLWTFPFSLHNQNLIGCKQKHADSIVHSFTSINLPKQVQWVSIFRHIEIKNSQRERTPGNSHHGRYCCFPLYLSPFWDMVGFLFSDWFMWIFALHCLFVFGIILYAWRICSNGEDVI